MKQYYFAITLLFSCIRCMAQSGTYTYSIRLESGQILSQTIAEPQFKYTDYDCYWFDKPGKDHYFFSNAAGKMGIIILREKTQDTSFEFRHNFEGSQFFINSPYNGALTIFHGDNDKGLLKVHFAMITPTELDITISGPVVAEYGTNSNDRVRGRLTAELHLYREGKYEKSAIAPNCNCDPTIYAYFYDPQIGRTPSDCENTVLWRIYNAIHPVFYNLNQVFDKSSGSDEAIIYYGSNDNPDIVEPIEPVDPCNPKNKQRGLVAVNIAQQLFSNDAHMLKYIESANSVYSAALAANSPEKMKITTTKMAEISKAIVDHSITMAEATKRMNALNAQASVGQPDLKQAEVYHHLDLKAMVNVTQYFNFRANSRPYPAGSIIQHNVPGAAFEIYSPSVKDEDGDWSPFCLDVFYGKFNVIQEGSQIKIVNPVIPPGLNKLTIVNTVISIAGGKDMLDAAMQKLDFKSIPALLANK